ncbi:immunoglobulin superfamily member 1-like [Sminthopsis crassicaudata]|uniref:immunoglobulin superfamily member 1-like n=1 Tax=Sminthopsis crassicaudata TaxID=9301 RepID=UPI003D68DAC7
MLPKPNIGASPGSLILPGKTVTIWCQMFAQSPTQDYTFALLNAKSLEPLLLQIPAGPRAEFSLPSVGAEDSGSYSYIYYLKTPPHRASHLSPAVELTVLGQLPRPTLWAQPGLVVAPGTNITLWCSRPRLASRPEDTGSYRCIYRDRTVSGEESESSEPLELVVTGSLPKPSLSAHPGLVVEPGKHVTLQCRQPPQSALWRATFTLLKVGSPQPLQSQSPAGTSADFPLLSVRAQDAGNYTCVYSERMAPYQVSEPSDALEIWVTDTLPKPSLSAWPGLEVASGSNVTLLCRGPSWIPRFALYKEGVEGILHSMEAHEDGGRFILTHVTPEHSGNYCCSYQLGTNESLWKQPSDALELLVREVREVRDSLKQAEILVPMAEDPQEVTYTQLNIRTFNKRKTDTKKTPTEATF